MGEANTRTEKAGERENRDECVEKDTPNEH